MSKAPTAAGLKARIADAKLSGTPPEIATRAKRAVTALVEQAAHQGAAPEAIADELASGKGAMVVAAVEAEARPAPTGLACQAGCAFCCILLGEDGGTITEAEAERLHTALAPLAGQPDGRAWHARACPALDPETRRCRAYEARPTICRSYHSRDAAACEAHAQGARAPGALLAGGHLSYLAAHALARSALKGRRRVDTFSLFEMAASAVDGIEPATALARARHKQAALDAELRRRCRGLKTKA